MSAMHREQRARILAELKRLRAAGWTIVAAPGPITFVIDPEPLVATTEVRDGWHVDAWHSRDAHVISQRRTSLRDAYAHIIMACDNADAEAACAQ